MEKLFEEIYKLNEGEFDGVGRELIQTNVWDIVEKVSDLNCSQKMKNQIMKMIAIAWRNGAQAALLNMDWQRIGDQLIVRSN